MFSGFVVQSAFINSKFQLPDLDLYLDFSIQIVRILTSGVLIQSNVSFRKTQKNKTGCNFTTELLKKIIWSQEFSCRMQGICYLLLRVACSLCEKAGYMYKLYRKDVEPYA